MAETSILARMAHLPAKQSTADLRVNGWAAGGQLPCDPDSVAITEIFVPWRRHAGNRYHDMVCYKPSTDWISKISGQTHDLWFDADLLRPDVGVSLISIALSIEKLQPPSHFLTISDVEKLIVSDTEHIGWYDVHSIAYDANTSRLHIRGNIPIDVFVQVGPSCRIGVERAPSR